MEPSGPTVTTHHFIPYGPLADSRPSAIRSLIASLSLPGRPVSLEKALLPVPRTNPSTRRWECAVPEEARPVVGVEEEERTFVEEVPMEKLEEFRHWKEEGGRKRGLEQEELEEEGPRKRRAVEGGPIATEPSKERQRTPRAKSNGPALILVPATPASSPSLSLHLGSIQRCIPRPYRHSTSIPSHRPAKVHHSNLLHSYLDPPSPHPPSPQLETLDPSTTLYPNALATLNPGRRGAWLIPLSRSLPYERSTKPSWDLTTSGAIRWTDDRLRELWNLLDHLHERGRMGDLICEAVLGEGGYDEGRGDHLRVGVEAELALPLRSFLRLFSVGWMRGEKEGDGEQFLRSAKLVWVDERGRAAFLA